MTASKFGANAHAAPNPRHRIGDAGVETRNVAFQFQPDFSRDGFGKGLFVNEMVDRPTGT
jgi:hypothetical protein